MDSFFLSPLLFEFEYLGIIFFVNGGWNKRTRERGWDIFIYGIN